MGFLALLIKGDKLTSKHMQVHQALETRTSHDVYVQRTSEIWSFRSSEVILLYLYNSDTFETFTSVAQGETRKQTNNHTLTRINLVASYLVLAQFPGDGALFVLHAATSVIPFLFLSVNTRVFGMASARFSLFHECGRSIGDF